VEHVVKRVVEFARGAPQSDDITCIAIVRKGADAVATAGV
jgi:serine phosphatase RsbU (regulator of sigma subunit)